MIKYKIGDMFSESAEAFVNTVNCVGVMGRGIAHQFKIRFPGNFRAYVKKCKRGDMHPGLVFVYMRNSILSPRYIINFPTKRHWRGKSRMEDIESGLASLVQEVQAKGIRSIVLPPLGSGLGGLEWLEVRKRIEQAFEQLADVNIVVYEPGGVPVDHRPNRSTNVPSMTLSRAALVLLIRHYLRRTPDPFVTLLEVHKLMYFLQLAGEPLKLKFKKAHYGPYAENLRHLLKSIDGHLVSGYAYGGDAPGRRLDLVPGAPEDAQAFLEGHPATLARIQRVGVVLEDFESPSALELLATVHWTVHNGNVETASDVLEFVRAWNPSKRRFTARQVRTAAERLMRRGWIEDGPLLDSYSNRQRPPNDHQKKLYSYVVRHDTGFAPNPFWGTCTLATCKHQIRRLAQVGDCIVGTGSKRIGRHEHLVFAMFVTETMTYSEYWQNEWFSAKKPFWTGVVGDKQACGDNIYFKLDSDRWHQQESFHKESDIPSDTRTDRILASTDFAYWGGTGPKIPDRFLRDRFVAGRNYRSRFSPDLIEDFVRWFRGLGATGRIGEPTAWLTAGKQKGCSPGPPRQPSCS